jgi:hypothetical protein
MALGNFLPNLAKTVGQIGTAVNPFVNAASQVGQLGSLMTQKNPVGQLASLMTPAITAAAPEAGIPLTFANVLLANHFGIPVSQQQQQQQQQSNADQQWAYLLHWEARYFNIT